MIASAQQIMISEAMMNTEEPLSGIEAKWEEQLRRMEGIEYKATM